MTTATVTFGVADLALEKAQCADTRLAHKSNPFLAFLSSMFAGLATRFIRSQAKDLVNTAVWFKGAKAQLATERADGELHASEDLVTALEKAETDILHLRAEMLEILMKNEQAKASSNFIYALRAWVAAAADFHDAVVDFRWAAMEADADADIKAGRVETFDSVDDLIAELKS